MVRIVIMLCYIDTLAIFKSDLCAYSMAVLAISGLDLHGSNKLATSKYTTILKSLYINSLWLIIEVVIV